MARGMIGEDRLLAGTSRDSEGRGASAVAKSNSGHRVTLWLFCALLSDRRARAGINKLSFADFGFRQGLDSFT